MSKHGYHKGTVLITCPSCKARHVISDHLGVFMDEKSSLEDILSKKGMSVTKGILNDDMEIWEDGSVYKAGSNKEGIDISAEASTKGKP
jgi:mitochondrial protein import protein ZIM17